MTDLIERLLAVEGGGDGTHWYRNPDGPEAAARIAELEAENHALKWGPEHIGHAVGRDLLADAQARIAELEAEVARLREALAVIVSGVPRVRATTYRADGEPSKQDQCPHGQRMYEPCDSCIEEFASAALAAPDTGGADG